MLYRTLRVSIAVFFIAFALIDISFAGACCGDEMMVESESDAACFCCCTHITVEPRVHFAVEDVMQSMIVHDVKSIEFGHSLPVYHPPKNI